MHYKKLTSTIYHKSFFHIFFHMKLSKFCEKMTKYDHFLYPACLFLKKHCKSEVRTVAEGSPDISESLNIILSQKKIKEAKNTQKMSKNAN